MIQTDPKLLFPEFLQSMNIKTKPFLRWAGGKQNIVEEILLNIPDRKLFRKYYEPFVGAGSLFFASNFSEASLSDINPQLINSYIAIKENYAIVADYLDNLNKKYLKNPDYYTDIRNSFNKEKDNNNPIQAARFIFLIHSNYNGMFRVNKLGNYNVPRGKLKPSLPSILLLEQINHKLQGVEIKCLNYIDLITEVGTNDFIYLDPPYPPLDWSHFQKQYTINNFSKEDHETLLVHANNLSQKKAYVMLSYPDTEYIRDLYSDWNIVELSTFRSISCKKERKRVKELLIKNY